MPHNAIIEDEKTGEQLLLWAVMSEKMAYKNKVSDEPIDTSTQMFSNPERVLGDHMEFKPLVLTVTAELTGDPGRHVQDPGGAGYDIEQYSKLQDFVNRVTTFAYTSYLFVDSTEYRDFSQPGLRIGGLAMTGFEPVKGGRRGVNMIGARITFQSVVTTQGGGTSGGGSIWHRGQQEPEPVEEDTWANDMSKYQASFYDPTLEEDSTVRALRNLGLSQEQGLSYVGRFRVLKPFNQDFFVTLEGTEYTLELRENTRKGFFTFGLAREETPEISQRKITYGEDLLAGVDDPIIARYHLVALDLSGKEDRVTPDNLGRTVHLYLLQETGAATVVTSGEAVEVS